MIGFSVPAIEPKKGEVIQRAREAGLPQERVDQVAAFIQDQIQQRLKTLEYVRTGESPGRRAYLERQKRREQEASRSPGR